MKKSELIKRLEEYPGDPEVTIMDIRKTTHHASSEPSGEGITGEFNVEFYSDSDTASGKPFIALSFENEDYQEDGMPDPGSSIIAAYLQCYPDQKK